MKVEQNPLLVECMSTLKDTSKDDNGNVMTTSELGAINFDKVKENYIKALGVYDKDFWPKSNDALIFIKNDKAAFIEFKNQEKPKAKDLRIKIADSMLILMDIIKKDMDYFRKEVEYILVYNKNELELKNGEREVQEAPSSDSIERIISDDAKEEIISFGLKRYEKYCFCKVHTYTKKQFEQKFVQKVQEGTY
jgi:hypothetical protein